MAAVAFFPEFGADLPGPAEVTHVRCEVPVHGRNIAQGNGEMSVTPISRSLRALKRQIVSADEAADVTERLVRLTYADTGSIAKSAANDAGSNERSARNWMEHKCAFSFATFLTLCQNSPKFKAVARKLLAMESALDPATEKALVDLQRALAETLERHHPSQKPVGIMEWCLGFLPDAATILDPFMGSGTTGVACANLGRKFIGIEIEPAYFEIACERIHRAYRQPRLFAEPVAKPQQAALALDGAA